MFSYFDVVAFDFERNPELLHPTVDASKAGHFVVTFDSERDPDLRHS
jgi:hypothetical protein